MPKLLQFQSFCHSQNMDAINTTTIDSRELSSTIQGEGTQLCLIYGLYTFSY
jgi:hypothetical protein